MKYGANERYIESYLDSKIPIDENQPWGWFSALMGEGEGRDPSTALGMTIKGWSG